jgi:hypothetical protein
MERYVVFLLTWFLFLLTLITCVTSQTDLQDCADMFVSLAKNTSITGQHIQVDSGLAIQHL